jgi:hypothetical protein
VILLCALKRLQTYCNETVNSVTCDLQRSRSVDQSTASNIQATNQCRVFSDTPSTVSTQSDQSTVSIKFLIHFQYFAHLGFSKYDLPVHTYLYTVRRSFRYLKTGCDVGYTSTVTTSLWIPVGMYVCMHVCMHVCMIYKYTV